jgi:hypothetical protein
MQDWYTYKEWFITHSVNLCSNAKIMTYKDWGVHVKDSVSSGSSSDSASSSEDDEEEAMSNNNNKKLTRVQEAEKRNAGPFDAMVVRAVRRAMAMHVQ